MLIDNRWDKQTHDAAAKDREENEEQYSPQARKKPTRERGSMRGQARNLLNKKGLLTKPRQKWKGRGEEEVDEWVDDGEAVEVETDVDVSKVPRS
jgi:hypothetical protein